MTLPESARLSASPEWLEHLRRQGAIFRDDCVESFGNPQHERRATADGNVRTDLSHFSLLRVSGEDAQTFLQGQFTNDLRQVNARHSQLNAYCNPKGRMLAIFRIFQRAESYYLHLPASLAEGILKRLRMYVLRAKVKIESADSELARMGISGPDAGSILQATIGAAPEAVDEVMERDGITVIRLPASTSRCELVAPPPILADLWNRLAKQTVPVGAGPWMWLDIAAGLPIILPATAEEFVPQMANLDLVNGLSFKKGCYPGQEIVARTHYLGKLKQRMFRAHVAEENNVRPGEKLFSPGFGEQAAGMVMAAALSPHGGTDLLIVAQAEIVRTSTLHTLNPSGPTVTVEALPYALPEFPESL